MRTEEDDLTGSPLTQILRGHPLRDDFVRQNGCIVLLTGLPGAGKTTLGLYLLRQLFLARETSRPAFMLSLVERSTQILRLAKLFGLAFKTDSEQVGLRLVMGKYPAEGESRLESLFADTGETIQDGDVLLIDGLSILTAEPEQRQEVLNLLREIKAKRLFAILVIEEAGPYETRFLEHRVDAIVRLRVDSTSGLRNLKIEKWRWVDYYPGEHSFRLQTYDQETGTGGVQLFPALNCLIGQRLSALTPHDVTSRTSVSSGTPGLDELIKLEGGAFRPGDRILLLGPPGAGKATVGMQFLNQTNASENDTSIVLAFGRDHREMEGVARGEATWKRHYRLQYSTSQLCIDEVVGALYALLRRLEAQNGHGGVTRLFVDNISDLRRFFESEQEYEGFLIGFLTLLRTFPRLVSMVSVQLPQMFYSYARISLPAANYFTVVIGINYQEQHNRLLRGLVVLRALERLHDSELKLVSVGPDGHFKVDPLGGFSTVGLLSGDPAPVHEEKPFLKLFYQNASEQEVIESSFTDFERRYPDDQTFVMVCTKNPDPNHWSFLGYAGVGHSNTKVVLLDKSTADAIKEHQALVEVPEHLVSKFANRFDSKISLFATTTSGHLPAAKFMLPYCADVGVLVYQWDVLQRVSGNDPPSVPESWDQLLALKDKMRSLSVEPSKPINYLFVIPNPEADAKNFVAFFFELCWSCGWEYDQESDAKKQLISWVQGPEFHDALMLMKRLVDESEGWIPNPVVGGHYHRSLFARRWFSKIHLRPSDAEMRADAGHAAFQFGIAPLPKITEAGRGYSCLNLYVLGVVSGALAPETGWMLASQLLGVDVDFDRALRKRGLPIVRTMFESAELQGHLRALVPAPKANPHYYKGQEHIFEEYTRTLRKVLSRSEPLFKRTSDVPRFASLEKMLAQKLPKLFDENDRWSYERIAEEIQASLGEIYS